jgi:hypothetical protein
MNHQYLRQSGVPIELSPPEDSYADTAEDFYDFP